MKKILSISNSFGVDATRYLYGVCRAAGEPVKVVTLYIGGCSLYRHYRNLLADEAAYAYYINGMDSGLKVSIRRALLSDEWDEVSTQQCSPDSGDWESYFPFLAELAAEIRRCAPKATLRLQETWSFAEDCPRFGLTQFTTREQMIPAVRDCYRRAAETVGADGIIPAMEAMNLLYTRAPQDTYRDGFHASLGLGRYTLACLWYAVLFGADPTGNSFRDFDKPLTEQQVALAQAIAKQAAAI